MTDDRLSELYRMYGPVLYARCARLLGDRAAAEDALQETFVRVQRHLAKAPDSHEALTWVYRIATNYCLNEIRDRKLRPRAEAELPETAGDSLERVLADRDLVAHIVRRSPEKLRAPAWLHHVDGLDQGEVARVLGISRRTVVNRLAEFADAARKFVRRCA
ncbi:MAG TPA: sigma-70 family RNA polymerase sigma factor [Kofleriaceae bacterium]|nr:sigma-70 family RNA polymerase sigma factor [Kofleriaceae bacterium]